MMMRNLSLLYPPFLSDDENNSGTVLELDTGLDESSITNFNNDDNHVHEQQRQPEITSKTLMSSLTSPAWLGPHSANNAKKKPGR